MSIPGLILQAFGLLTVLFTLASALRSEKWWIRVFDFPRLQILFITTGVLILFLLFSEQRTADLVLTGALGLCLFFQVFRIWPYTPFGKKEVQNARAEGKQISLLITNVLEKNRQSAPLLELIRKTDPDMVLAIETDKWWDKKLSVLKKDYEHLVSVPQENLYGMHLFSKYPLTETEVRRLVHPETPSIRTTVNVGDGLKVKLYCLHPFPPSPKETGSTKERDAELVIVAREVQNVKVPVIVAGDLNDVAWSKTTALFRKISGLLDPRRGRGFYNTFNAKNPFLRWPLDHLFHSEQFTLVKLQRLGYIQSDHFPILVVLRYEPRQNRNNLPPAPDQDEQKMSQKKLDKIQ